MAEKKEAPATHVRVTIELDARAVRLLKANFGLREGGLAEALTGGIRYDVRDQVAAAVLAAALSGNDMDHHAAIHLDWRGHIELPSGLRTFSRNGGRTWERAK